MDYSVTVNGQDASTEFAALLLGSLGIILFLALFIWVLFVIAYWKMFTKAGEPGWKSIIPIYHTYVAWKICWKTGAMNFWIWVAAMFVSCLGSVTVSVNGSGVSTEGNPILNIIAIVGAVVSLVWSIRFCLRQAHAYNKGVGMAIVSIFFPNIATLIYGFGESCTYQGPQD